jgi:hypothetical protein
MPSCIGGAKVGSGNGRVGQSYAIPTKDWDLHTLPRDHIAGYVATFLVYASAHYELRFFLVTKIGCGLAGYKDREIAPMFRDAPPNCVLPKGW